jgi:hypothetical protein
MINNKVVLEKGEFFIFDAQEDKDSAQIYFSTKEALIEYVAWWIDNRTDSFVVYQGRFEK